TGPKTLRQTICVKMIGFRSATRTEARAPAVADDHLTELRVECAFDPRRQRSGLARNLHATSRSAKNPPQFRRCSRNHLSKNNDATFAANRAYRALGIEYQDQRTTCGHRTRQSWH